MFKQGVWPNPSNNQRLSLTNRSFNMFKEAGLSVRWPSHVSLIIPQSDTVAGKVESKGLNVGAALLGGAIGAATLGPVGMVAGGILGGGAPKHCYT